MGDFGVGIRQAQVAYVARSAAETLRVVERVSKMPSLLGRKFIKKRGCRGRAFF